MLVVFVVVFVDGFVMFVAAVRDRFGETVDRSIAFESADRIGKAVEQPDGAEWATIDVAKLAGV